MGYYTNEEVCYTLVHFLLLDLVEFYCCFRPLLQKSFTNYIVVGRVVILFNTE